MSAKFLRFITAGLAGLVLMVAVASQNAPSTPGTSPLVRQNAVAVENTPTPEPSPTPTNIPNGNCGGTTCGG